MRKMRQRSIVKMTGMGNQEIKNPEGEITRVLGARGEHETEIHLFLQNMVYCMSFHRKWKLMQEIKIDRSITG